MTAASKPRPGLDVPAREANGDAFTQLTQFGAGALAGLVNTLVLSPLDVVKTRLQVQGSAAVPPTNYRGLFHALRCMLRQEGLSSYYRGLSASLSAFVPNWAIYWYSYETFKRTYTPRGARSTPFVHVFAALSAGAITAVDMTSAPAHRRYRSVPHGLRKIIAEEGVSGLYKGLTPTLLGLGHVAIQFPLYEHLKSSLSGGKYEDLKAAHVLIASSLSKIAASAVFYPHEVLRTQIQVDRTVAATGTEPARMASLIRDIIRKDGAKGLYRGFATNLMRTVPACMLTFTSYELVKRYAHKHAMKGRENLDIDLDPAIDLEDSLAKKRKP
ncbi:unnamed protein product [Chondrus crispus]|uniref:Mitochondrial carrier protein n=1 Tax=Chondrus crispus TaxID=2769 RepID=R7QQP7_CHOCR|nr:unnamed protein product [Chondrus crispus]CDF40822.1 unnamed protein product [Chondrus crispus]|eukprot:XP_005711116.1 unnamed protein product [Chondrus crispus]